MFKLIFMPSLQNTFDTFILGIFWGAGGIEYIYLLTKSLKINQGITG